MKTLLTSLLLFLSLDTLAAEAPLFTVDLVTLDQLAQKYVEDVKRIEVYYPKQFSRLEMDWNQTAQLYLHEYAKEKDPVKKIHIFAKLYNSFHNAHHRPLSVKGLAKYEPTETLDLPVRIFGEGLKLSQGKFTISEIAKNQTDLKINTGDTVLEYDGLKISDYVLAVRDEASIESPEAHINRIAKDMTLQRRCRWGKLKCWRANDKIILKLEDVNTKKTKTVSLSWNKVQKGQFAQPFTEAQFPTDESGWSFKSLEGPYAVDYDAIPDPHTAFMGQLSKDGKKWLVIKIFSFQSIAFMQNAIQEARKPEYQGVILDFAENGGGKDSAMTFVGGILGTKYNLETSAIRLVKEFQDIEALKEATFSNEKSAFLHPLLQSKSLNKLSPFMSFACLDTTCPFKLEYSNFLDYYDRPRVVTDTPIKKIALITGRGTASKTDSIAALFRATKAGPILGTPALASSGAYYFKKDYVVAVGKKAMTLTVTFTPDFSLAGDCEEVQANPPTPDIIIERTFANRNYYDTLSWIKATAALEKWDTPSNIGISCSSENAQKKLKEFKLVQVQTKN